MNIYMYILHIVTAPLIYIATPLIESELKVKKNNFDEVSEVKIDGTERE